MPHSHCHCHGGDAWGSRIFARPVHQHGRTLFLQYSDFRPSNGRLSDALRHRLGEWGILYMEVLLQRRGIRTLRALESMEHTERADLLVEARELYELVDIFPGTLKNTLNELFGDVSAEGVLLASSWAMQSGATPYMYSHFSGHGGWGHNPLLDSRPGGPELLSEPRDDCMKRVLGAALLCAQEVVGRERFTMCFSRLNLSEELVVASCLEVAEVQEEIRDRERKKTLKAAKKLVRDFVIRRNLYSAKAAARAYH